MTNEEIITQLQDIKCHCQEMYEAEIKNGDTSSSIWEKDVEALDFAIKALEQQPCEDCKVKKEAYIHGYDYGVKDWFKAKTEPCEDCISRELLLKHLENITMDTNPDHYECKDKWYQANGFNLCKVGIEMYVENMPSVTLSYNSVKTELDCISREDTLNKINALIAEYIPLMPIGWTLPLNIAKTINELPSVTPSHEDLKKSLHQRL